MYASNEPLYTNNKYGNINFKYKKERIYKYKKEFIYIYQTNSQYIDRTFEEIQDSYGLKWCRIYYGSDGHTDVCSLSVCENTDKGTNVRDSYSCNTIKIHKTPNNYAPEISNINECYNLIYEPDFFMNIKKYIGIHTKWRHIHNVMPYLLEYVNN